MGRDQWLEAWTLQGGRVIDLLCTGQVTVSSMEISPIGYLVFERVTVEGERVRAEAGVEQELDNAWPIIKLN